MRCSHKRIHNKSQKLESIEIQYDSKYDLETSSSRFAYGCSSGAYDNHIIVRYYRRCFVYFIPGIDVSFEGLQSLHSGVHTLPIPRNTRVVRNIYVSDKITTLTNEHAM